MQRALKGVIERGVKDKRTSGRRRMGMLDDLMEGTYGAIRKKPEDRASLRS